VDQGFYCLQYLVRDSWLKKLGGRSDLTRIMRRAEEHRREAMSAFIAERGDQLLGLSVR
jgi:hypothetical protein